MLDRNTGTGVLGQRYWDRDTGTGILRQGYWDRDTGTGILGQGCWTGIRRYWIRTSAKV